MAKQDSTLTRDWPLSLIRSEARDTLAMRIYEARCTWRRERANWHALATEAKAFYRTMAQEILEKVNA